MRGYIDIFLYTVYIHIDKFQYKNPTYKNPLGLKPYPLWVVLWWRRWDSDSHGFPHHPVKMAWFAWGLRSGRPFSLALPLLSLLEWEDGFPVVLQVDDRPAVRLRFVERLVESTDGGRTLVSIKGRTRPNRVRPDFLAYRFRPRDVTSTAPRRVRATSTRGIPSSSPLFPPD